jgi:hypothetical protein
VSILFGPRERRASPFPEPPIPPNSQLGGGNYARVDLTRTESSLQKVAVWSCVNLVATIAETMPLDYFPRPRETRPLPPWLADLGGDGHGLPDWLYQYVYSAMLRGNTVGLIGGRDRLRGTPNQIWPADGLVADRAARDDDRHGHRGLEVRRSSSSRRARTPSGMLTNDKELDQKQSMTAKQRFMAAIRGRREPVVLGGGWKYQAIQVSPNESQFLETQKYTAAECAGSSAPGCRRCSATRPAAAPDLHQRRAALPGPAHLRPRPWLVRIERHHGAAARPAVRQVQPQGAAPHRPLTRFKVHEIALRNQFEVVNEVRELEDKAARAVG